MRHPVLWSIAASLSRQAWSYDSIATHLTLHLPKPLSRLVPKAARVLRAALPRPVTPDAQTNYPVLSRMTLGQRLILHARQTGMDAAFSLTEPPFRPAETLANLPLARIATSAALAEWLAVPEAQLTRLADLCGLSARSADPFGPHDILHHIPKADGSLRLIEEPKPFLKHLQRRILSGMLDLIPPHASAFGFTKGRNVLQAAAKHCGEQMVVAFDLKDFFPSIGVARVLAIFRSLGYPRAVAMPLAGLCTALPLLGHDLPDGFRNRHLPQVAPTSPALANLSAFRLDGLARSLDATIPAMPTI